MKVHTILFIFFISVGATAQEVVVTKVDAEQKKFFIGMNFSPDYCYQP